MSKKMSNIPALATIRDAAKLLNVSTKTLRRWEARGVLVPVRTEGGHRRYEIEKIKELKGNKRHVRLTQTYQVVTPALSPKVDMIPVLYSSLHIDQKRILKTVFAVFIFVLISYTAIKITPISARDLIKAKILGQKINNTDKKITNANSTGSVLAATASNAKPIFNINIESAFKDNSLFTKDVEIDGDLTLKKQIIGNVDLTGVVIVGGNSITTSQSIFNLINTTASTLNIGGAATTLSLGATTGNTNINNNLNVKGNSIISGSETVTGKITGSGDLTISGLTTLGGAETVAGKITGNGDLDISGDATFGDITEINGVTYSFPDSQGAASTLLTNDGSGNLTWTNPSIGALSGVLGIANGGTNNSTAYTTGSVIFSDGTSLTQDNANFFWDNTGNQLGIGNAAPGTTLDVTGTGRFSGALTASNGFTLTTGALNLTSTSGTSNLTSTATSGDSFAFTNNSLSANNSNLLNLTFKNANTGAGVVTNGLSINATGSTPSSLTNNENLINLGATALGSNTFTGINFGSGLSNYVSSPNWTVTAAGAETIASDLGVNGGNITTSQTTANIFTGATTLGIGNAAGTTTINGILAVSGASNLNGNTILGDATTDAITFTGRVAQDSDILPIGTTGTNDLGSVALPWDNVYANAFVQNGFNVCDSSGANCPAGSVSYWDQSSGLLFAQNNTVDLVIGANSTASAKFAFTGVNGGLPTASIAGNIANVSTYLNGNGNLSTTNAQDLTLGSSTTGNVVLNSRGLVALTANGSNITTSGTFSFPSSNTLTGVSNYLQASQGYSVGGNTTYFFDASGNLNANSGTFAGNLTANADSTLGNAITDNITFTGRVAADSDLLPIGTTGVNDLGSPSLPWDNVYGVAFTQNGNTVCDSSGNCPTGAQYWKLANGTISPFSDTLDVTIGASATSSAKFAFTGVNSGTPTASVAGSTANVATYLTGNGNLAVTNGAHLTLGGSSTGQVDVNNNLNVSTGNGYLINNASVLNSTTLGSSVVNSSLTSVGALASGSIANGFGTIATANTITGTTLNGTTGVNTGAVAGTQRIDSTGNLLNIANISASGYATISGSVALGNTIASVGPGNLDASGRITGVSIYQGANQVCDASNNCGYSLASTNYWQLNNKILSPSNSTYDLTVGGTATGSAFQVFANNGNVATTGTIALPNSNTLTGVSNYLQLSQGVSVGNGTTYYFNSTGDINANAGTFAGTLTANGDTTLGNAISDNISFSGRVAQDSDLLPIGTTGTNDLGSGSLPWDNVYANVFVQNGYNVCDASGANCPTAGSGGSKWTLGSGVISPFVSSLDVLFGGNSTASAKFAFINNASGLPTASIAGDIANVATYLTGNGNLAVTNGAHLTLGGSSTGQVDVSNDLNLANTKSYLINGTSVLNGTTLGSGVTGSSLTSVGALSSGSIANGFGTIATANTITGTTLNGTTGVNTGAVAGTQRIDSTGNLLNIGYLDASSYASVSGSLTFKAGASSIQTTAANPLTIGGNTTGNITLSPSNNIAGGYIAPAVTNVTDLGTASLIYRNIYGGTIAGTTLTQGGNTVCDTSGNCSAVGNYWGQTSGALYPVNNTVDFLIGSNSTASAKFAFTGVLSGTPTASISGTYLTSTGTLSNTSMRDLTLGGSTTGNVVLNSRGSAALTANGANLTTTGTVTLPNTNTLTGVANYLQNSQGYSVGGGTTYYFDASGNINANAGTFAGTLTANGDTVIGNAITDNITFGGRVAQDSDLLPITATGTNDLGSASLPWDNVYGVAFTQNGNSVCDSSGNCSAIGNYFGQTNGALYPVNNTVDFLIGANATTSAKFAFTGVNSGTPTASISGTYLTSDGTLATTKNQHLTLGGVTTGQVDVNNNLNVSTGNGYLINNASVLNSTTLGSSVVNSSLTSTGALASGSIASGFGTIATANTITGTTLNGTTGVNTGAVAGTQRIDSTGNLLNIGYLDASSYASVSGSLTFKAGASSIQTTAFNNLTVGGSTTGNITLSPSNNIAGGYIAPAVTNVTDLGTASLIYRNIYGGTIAGTTLTQGGNTVCDSSGNCAGVSSMWQLSNKIISPAISSYDLAIGGTATGSAFQVFGIERTTGDIAKLNSTVITSGNILEATASAITSGNLLKLGQAGASNFTGNGIFIDADNTGGGSFTGNFLKFDNAGSTQFTVGSTGVLTLANAETIDNLVNGSINIGATTLELTGGNTIHSNQTSFDLLNTTTTTLNIGNAATTLSLGATTGTSTVRNSLAVNGDITLGDAITDNITFTGRVAQDSDLLPITATGTNDLGSASLPWDNIYGVAFTQNGNSVCDTSGNCSTVGNQWQLNNKIVSPAISSYDLAIGGTATGSAFQVFGSPTAAGDIAKINSSVITTGNLFEATASAITSGNIVKLGSGGSNGNFTGNGIYMDLDNTGGNSFTGNFLKFDNAASTKFTVNSSGSIGVAAASGIDTITAGALAIGTGTASSVSISKTGVTTTVNGTLTSSETLTASNGLTLTTGALSLTSTSGTSSLTSTATSGDSFAFTNNSFTTANSNLANLTFKNNQTAGAGVAVNGLNISATGSTPNSGTNTENLINLGATALGSNTFNGINFGNGLTNYINGANFTVTSAGAVTALGGLSASGGTVALNSTGTSSTTIGNTTGTTTFTGNILPSTTNTSSLGSSSSLQFATIYANVFTQNGNNVCDAAGNNCPTGASGGSKWKLSNGAISPFTDTLDVLIGNSATSSAKFAFKNVATGTPTASISGSVTNVATYLDGNGNLSTTNMANLTLGSSTTGNVVINSRGSAALTANGIDLTAGGDLAVNGATSADITTTTTTATLFDTTATTLSLGGAATTALNLGNGSGNYSAINLGSGAGTHVINIAGTGATSSDTINIGTGGTAADTITIGSTLASTALALNDDNWNITGAGAANFVSIGVATPGSGAFTTLTSNGASTIGTGTSLTNTFGSGASSINTIGSVTTPGALTLHGATTLDNSFTISGNNTASISGTLTVGNGTTNTIQSPFGPLNLAYKSGLNAWTTGFTLVDTTGNAIIANDLAVNGGDLTTSQTTANLFTNATTLGIGAASGTTTVNNGLAVTGATTLNGNSTLGDAITDTITFTGRVAADADLLPIGTTGTNDLGSASLPWDNVYGVAFNQNGNTVCDSTNNCNYLTGTNLWQLNTLTVSPGNSTYDLAVGGTATSTAKFQAFALEKAADATSRLAKLNSSVLTTGTLFEATASAITSGNIVKLGTGGSNGNFTGNGLYMDFDNTGGSSFTGNFLKFDNATSTKFSLGSTGVLTLANSETIDNTVDGTVNVGATTFKITGGTDVVSDQTSVNLFNATTTTLSLGGAATTALNIGNGSGAYTAINLGSGSGTHTINIAGTGATSADTINIGTGGTGADTINIGSNASTTALNLTSGTGSQTFASSLVSGTGTSGAFAFTANSLTTGTGAYFNSSSITTGDLVNINATGTTLTTGYLLNVENNSSSVFSIGANQITSALPHQFTAVGDVNVAYDLIFTNQTASTIDSYGPLTLRSGESFESNNLTLNTYNSGNILLSPGASGHVGIGVGITPIAMLDVWDSSTSTASAIIRNTSTTAATVGLAIKMDATTIGATTRFINFMDKNGTITGKIQGNTATTVSFTGNGTDMAEWFTKDDANAQFATGTVMCQGTNGLVACSSNESAKIIGIVSASPSFIGGIEGSNKVLIGLTGQVPVLMDPASPSLNPGDLLTISNNGLAIKATSAGFIIGRAQSSWNSGNTNSTNVVISNIWADPNLSINGNGLLNIADDINNPGYKKLTDGNGNTVNMLSGLTSLLTNTFSAFQGTVDNLLVKIGLISPEILTRDIKPLAGERDINIQVGTATESGKLALKNAADQTVAGIDSAGNATFSGQLNSESASISAGLYAGTIYADQIIARHADFGSVNTATLSGVTRQQIEDILASVEQDQNLLKSAQDWNITTATVSGSFNELNLKDLFVTGITALDSLSVTNNFTLAGDLAISKITTGNNSIVSLDTLTNPLSLQSSASQPLYLMAGKIQIDTNGNMQVLGNLAVGGVLSASAVNIAEDPNATTSSQILTSQASAGVGTIASGSAEMTIVNPNIKSNSLIFVTPTSKVTENLYVKSEASGSATIGFASIASESATFNWWIVGVAN